MSAANKPERDNLRFKKAGRATKKDPRNPKIKFISLTHHHGDGVKIRDQGNAKWDG